MKKSIEYMKMPTFCKLSVDKQNVSDYHHLVEKL